MTRTAAAHGSDAPVSLFEVCPLPGCSVLVAEPAEACASCQKAFGAMLHPASGPARDRDEIAAELRERDHVVRGRYRERIVRGTPYLHPPGHRLGMQILRDGQRLTSQPHCAPHDSTTEERTIDPGDRR